MQAIPMPSVSIPSLITSGTSLIIDNNSSGGWGDTRIELSSDIIIGILMAVMREEMKMMRNTYREIDYHKLQEMVNSGDGEMNNLGYTILNKHTRYCSRIISAFKVHPYMTHQLETILHEYIFNNRTNIGEQIL